MPLPAQRLKTGFSIDASSWNAKFPDIAGKMSKGWAGRGLYYAGLLLIRDALTVMPYAPHDTGDLWRSQTVKEATNETYGMTVEAGFNIVYAAKCHESPDGINWKLKGSGPKFLSSKLAMYKDRYMEATAMVIRNKGEIPRIEVPKSPNKKV